MGAVASDGAYKTTKTIKVGHFVPGFFMWICHYLHSANAYLKSWGIFNQRWMRVMNPTLTPLQAGTDYTMKSFTRGCGH